MRTREPLPHRKAAWWAALVVAFVAVVLPAAARAAGGASTSADPETLRQDLAGFAAAMVQHAGSAMVGADLQARVAQLDTEELAALADALAAQPRWPSTLEIVRSFAISPGDATRSRVVEPGPPSDRCPPPFLSVAAILNLILTREAFEIVAAGLHAGCDITVAGFNPSPLCVAGGVADAVVITIVAVLDSDATCVDETDSLAHAAAVQTQAGIAAQLDAIEAKLDANAGAVQRTAERQLEAQVLTCRPLVSLTLPHEFGGRLEDVRDLVVTWLANAQLAGVGDIPEATKRLLRGNQALEARDYAAAYRSFCLAYRVLLPH